MWILVVLILPIVGTFTYFMVNALNSELEYRRGRPEPAGSRDGFRPERLYRDEGRRRDSA